MQLRRLHDWAVTPQEAVALQNGLRGRTRLDRTIDPLRLERVAGVDVSVKANRSRAAVVVASFPRFEILEIVTAERETPFPYVPGLLSFREGPVLEEAFGKIETEPDLFLFDGQGVAHPRRLGIAAHLGLWLERPTVGVGKSRLTGRHHEPGDTKGMSAPLLDGSEVIGRVLRTRDRVSPVYVSPGHLCDLASAVAVTLACTTRYRLPEPIRMAHNAAGDFTP